MHSLEEKAQKALELIIALEDAEQDRFKQLVIGQIGKELLAVFGWYATAVFPDNPEEVVHDLVHLMITAYLIKSNEMEPLFPQMSAQEG
ncbi:MAG: hypothetical protein ACE5LG_03275 [Anaerolineae bacterium]